MRMAWLWRSFWKGVRSVFDLRPAIPDLDKVRKEMDAMQRDLGTDRKNMV